MTSKAETKTTRPIFIVMRSSDFVVAGEHITEQWQSEVFTSACSRTAGSGV